MPGNYEELADILTRFSESGWDLIDAPSKAWLNGALSAKELIPVLQQADAECGACGCEFDPLYKRAIALLPQP
ncbi:MAG: hypothetical protein FWD58_10635 [Firmicutes bacterium]|nr:hypothetical protein [Bacillota bacterium]